MNRISNRITLSAFFVLLLLFSAVIVGCGSTEIESTAPIVTETTTEPVTEEVTEAVTEPINEYATIEQFVDLCNGASDFVITDLVPMDIHGEDYQTEFRLFAFENAVGLKGSIGDDSIQIVNYGALANDQLRIYARVSSLEIAEALVTDLVYVLDDTISADDLAFELSNPSSIYLGEAGYISGYINTDYANGGVSGYDIMIDCTHINFQ